jgi:GMP synthase (glutamine-hydrolysing)
MSKRIVIVDHPLGGRDDRATSMLVAHGYEVDWRRPADGDSLPAPDAGYAAAIVHGGIENLSESHDVAYLNEEMGWTRRWVEAQLPFAGFCLGGQMLAQSFGAKVGPHPDRIHEIGFAQIEPCTDAASFLKDSAHMYEWHKEGFELPAGAELLARGQVFPRQAFRVGDRAYGLQFHPEVSPQNFQSWLEASEPMTCFPGAHSRERQTADAERFDASMEKWLARFLAQLLNDDTLIPEVASHP